jgi:hypothetical protein
MISIQILLFGADAFYWDLAAECFTKGDKCFGRGNALDVLDFVVDNA